MIVPNPFDLCYDLSHEKWNRIRLHPKTSSNLVWMIYKRFKHFLKRYRSLVKYSFEKINSEVVVFYTTPNQKAALEPIINNLDNVKVLSSNSNYYNKTPNANLINAFSLLSFYVLLWHYLFSSGYKRRSLHSLKDKYLRAYGYYFYYYFLLKKNRKSIKLIIVANDHFHENLPFNYAALNNKIKIAYIQHASVTKEFPPLIFDYAFLDGIDAFEKYDGRGKKNTKCFLTGIMKLDPYLPLPTNDKNTIRKKIGVCIGGGDDYDKFILLIEQMKNEGLEFIVRPHPLIIDDWRKICELNDFNLSNPYEVGALNFLISVDIIVAGNSNILLEAAILGVKTIYYLSKSESTYDYYGFIQNDIITAEYLINQDIILLIKAIRNYSINYKKQKLDRYCATIGTHYEGRSTELVSTILNNINNGAEPADWKLFNKLESISLKCYSIKT